LRQPSPSQVFTKDAPAQELVGEYNTPKQMYCPANELRSAAFLSQKARVCCSQTFSFGFSRGTAHGKMLPLVLFAELIPPALDRDRKDPIFTPYTQSV
jgi:hypothetical protein